MKNNGIRIRPANLSDAAVVLRWRNDPRTRLYSRNTEPISPEIHGVWFESVLANPDRHLYVGEHDGELLGQVRFDLMELAQVNFEVSIALDPEHRGQGLAAPLLLGAENTFLESTRAHALYAWVNASNVVSQHLFQGAGYRIEQSKESQSNWWIKEINV